MRSIRRLALTAFMFTVGGLAAVAPTASATTGTTDGLQWATTGSPANAVTITGYVSGVINSRTSLDIPSLIDVDTGPNVQYLPVTVIDSYALQNLTTIEQLTIPDSVVTISGQAFFGITNVVGITIGNGVTTIGLQAFYQPTPTTSLTRLTLGDHVTTIGNLAFAGSAGLSSLTLPPSVRTIGGCAFCDMPGLERLTINDGITSVGSCAFCVTTPTTQPPLVVVVRGNATPFPAYGMDGHTGGTHLLRYRDATGPWEGNTAFDGFTYGYITEAPPAPIAAAGAEAATITVVAPTRGETPTSYTVSAAPGGQTCTVTGAAGSCTVHHLTPGTAYTFTAIAHSADPAPSDPSGASAPVTPTAAPPATPSPDTAAGSGVSQQTAASVAQSLAPALRIGTPRVTRMAIRSVFTATGPGRVRQVARISDGAGRAATTVCTMARTIHRVGTVTLICRLTRAARVRLEQRPLDVVLTTTFTPSGGGSIAATAYVRLPRSVR
jgi:hypothetical protein